MSSRALLLLSSLALVAAASIGCASASPALRRGAEQADVFGEMKRVLNGHGFTCATSPDMTYLECRHPDAADLSFEYNASVNVIQGWTAFARKEDEALADAWRGDCGPAREKIEEINKGYIVKLFCNEQNIVMVFHTWLPERGLTDDDVASWANAMHAMIAETIRASQMLKEDAPPAAAPPAAPPATGT
jgi:hypothetical protein